jgi:hypothetical protein
MLRIRKDWTTKSPDRPDNQQANPMLSMTTVSIEEEVNHSWAAENKLHANKPRGRKEATNNEEDFLQQSATSTR